MGSSSVGMAPGEFAIESACREQVEYMMISMPSLKEQSEPLDATDAPVPAICHARRLNRPCGRAANWKQFILEHPDRVSVPHWDNPPAGGLPS